MTKPILPVTFSAARSACLCAAVCVAAAGMAAGQPAQQPPSLIRVSMMKVKSGMGLEYEGLARESIEAMKKAGIPWRQTWTTSGFGALGTYFNVYPLNKFADLDLPGPLLRGMGETWYQQWLTRFARAVESTHVRAMQYRPDLSIRSERVRPPVMALIVEVATYVGKEEAYEQLLKAEVLPALRKAQVKDCWVHRTLFGGSDREFTVVLLYENWAEVDAGSPLVRALGREGALALVAKTAGVVESMNYSFSRLLPELSYGTP